MNEAPETNSPSAVDPQKVSFYLMTHQKYFTPAVSFSLQKELEQLSDTQFNAVSSMQLNDPSSILAVSVLFGGLGIDRFMLGQVGMGVLKLLTGGLLGFLWILDWFLIGEAAREKNYTTICTAAQMMRLAPGAFIMPGMKPGTSPVPTTTPLTEETVIVPFIGADSLNRDAGYENRPEMTEVIVSEGVVSIGWYAFAGCIHLRRIDFPASLRRIGNFALEGCEELSEIHFAGTVSEWKSITRGASWDRKTGAYTIVCTDGQVGKQDP